MTSEDLKCLKSNIDQVVVITAADGKRILAKLISVFDEESDPDVFYFDVTSDPSRKDADHKHGCSIDLRDITSVKDYREGVSS
jgi:hypothetical protein